MKIVLLLAAIILTAAAAPQELVKFTVSSYILPDKKL